MPAAASVVGIGWRYPHYREVLARQPALDFLEVHSENFFAPGGAAMAVLLQARQDYPISLHGVGLSLGSATGLDPWHLDQLERLVRQVQPLRVSDHACFARGHLPAGPGVQAVAVHASDLLPIPFSHAALEVLVRNVQQVQDRLQQRFMVENLSAYLQWNTAQADRFGSEPEFLAELARRTGCLLLVDVNNIYVNALNDQLRQQRPRPDTLPNTLPSTLPGTSPEPQPGPLQQCQKWLDAIPPEAVGELHLAGHVTVDDNHGSIVIDDHGSRVCDAVWQLYAHAVQRFKTPAQVLPPTLVEWDTQVPALDVLLAEADQARHIAANPGAPAP